ncbi:hypothetical protein HII31_06601 [Pseudocercospora fuligena]|uniref:Uncharacterized protein n=1 Tax=Pseudocercospora fuligena TaxID=685502 RepID=A0A8H6RGB5_9PEZI|nr:hypothetical protein HII31_06601 [Pseudocercospora fuligena]
MAPDINSLPTSPRADGGRISQLPSQNTSRNPSRRTSAIMPPPTHPASASAPRPPSTNQSPTLNSSEQMAGLPLRHPRPLTAAELYLECEKEQEAVVNRLTRELTALRAQSASVASNASSVSSTSANASLLPVDITDPNPTHQMMGATHPTPSRRHRSSSSVSASSRGIPTPSTSASTQAHAGSISQASADRAAAAGGERNSLSRNPSVSASGNNTPARRSMEISRSAQYALPHRPSLSRDPSQTTISSMHAQAGSPAPSSHVVPNPLPSPAQSPASQVSVSNAMQHFADTRAQREELEHVKRENDVLRQRVRDLERALRQRRRDSSQSVDAQRPVDLTNRETPSNTSERASREFTRVPSFTSPPHSAGLGVWDGGVGGVAGPRERSESQSTTASSRRGVGIPEDDNIRVGESANSVGMGRGA